MESYLLDIDDLVAGVQYGDINLTLKRHNGKTTQIAANNYDKKRFTDNTEAVTHLLMELKKLTDAEQTGSISFTLMLKSGKIVMVIQQGYESKDYK